MLTCVAWLAALQNKVLRVFSQHVERVCLLGTPDVKPPLEQFHIAGGTTTHASNGGWATHIELKGFSSSKFRNPFESVRGFFGAGKSFLHKSTLRKKRALAPRNAKLIPDVCDHYINGGPERRN